MGPGENASAKGDRMMPVGQWLTVKGIRYSPHSVAGEFTQLCGCCRNVVGRSNRPSVGVIRPKRGRGGMSVTVLNLDPTHGGNRDSFTFFFFFWMRLM